MFYLKTNEKNFQIQIEKTKKSADNIYTIKNMKKYQNFLNVQMNEVIHAINKNPHKIFKMISQKYTIYRKYFNPVDNLNK